MKWFKHDAAANRNSKLEKVIIKYGSAGYALYWLCLELIADRIDHNNADFELRHDAETLANRLKIDTIVVEEIMKYMISLNLFECSDGVITCLKMADRIENSIVKNCEIKIIQDRIRNKNPGKSRKIPENPGQIRLDKNRIEEKIDNIPYSQIIDFMNKEIDTSYRSSTEKTRAFIRARFNEGFTFEDFKNVISFKKKEWFDNPKMKVYLRPETLFGTKFEGYLQAAIKDSEKIKDDKYGGAFE